MTDTAAALDEVGKVADAVLFEGYLLYPYRASAQKNQIRWQWGVLTPAGYGAGSNEPSCNRTECMVEPDSASAIVHVRLRFLQVQARSLIGPDGTPVEELVVDGIRHFAWDEGLPRHIDIELRIDELAQEKTVPLTVPASESSEPITDASGAVVGQLVRTCWPLTGRLVAQASPLPGPYDVVRLRLDVHNDAECSAETAREDALRSSLIGTHSVLAVSPGGFLSMTDPPQWAKSFVADCVNTHTWPVLAGPPERSDLMLSSPIILDDHPQLAPESTLDLFDGTENDEILTLRTLVLTDEEKREARATDPRAAGIIDAVDAMPPEIFERLHGVIRSMRSMDSEPAEQPAEQPAAPAGSPQHSDRFDDSFGVPIYTTPEGEVSGVPILHTPTDAGPPGLRPVGGDSPSEVPPDRLPWFDAATDAKFNPETDSVLIGGTPVAKGSAVVLRPGSRGDVQDQFLVGMRATVQAVVHDLDGQVHIAVSLDDDPAAEMQLAHGRFRYFHPDEVEVVAP